MSFRWINNYEDLYDINENGHIRRHFLYGNVKTVNSTLINNKEYVVLSKNGIYTRFSRKNLIETTFVDLNNPYDNEANIFQSKGAWMKSKERMYYKQLNK